MEFFQKKQIHVKKMLIFYKKMLRVIDWESSENRQWELLMELFTNLMDLFNCNVTIIYSQHIPKPSCLKKNNLGKNDLSVFKAATR